MTSRAPEIDANVISATPSLSFDLPRSGSDQQALESVLDRLAPLFECVPAIDGERDGALLVVSDDAGTATTVQFWRDALAVGPGLASPGAFPWCLANAPCAMIARRFGITGPNLTWLTSFTNPTSAFDAPSAWLEDWLCLRSQSEAARSAWLVALHFGEPAAWVKVWHWTGARSA